MASKFVIKNIETGEYFIGWKSARDKHGNTIYRDRTYQSYWGKIAVKNPIFSKKEIPKIYNSKSGARKIISEFAGSSFAEHDKLSTAGKVLYGNSELAKYDIVECRVKIVEVKKKKVDLDGEPTVK